MFSITQSDVHTVVFGDIEVTKQDYSKIMIHDNISFNTDNWNFEFNVLKINDENIDPN